MLSWLAAHVRTMSLKRKYTDCPKHEKARFNRAFFMFDDKAFKANQVNV